MQLRKSEQPERILDTWLPDWLRRRILRYIRRGLSTVIDAIVLLTVTILGYTVILYFCRAAWHLYLYTQVGEQFVRHYPEAAQNTADILHLAPLALAFSLTLTAFAICTVAGAICRLTHLGRYVYAPFSFLVQMAVCGVPLAALTGLYVLPQYGFPDWGSAFLMVLLPTLSVFGRCFSYAEMLLPELGDIRNLLTTR